ncbi:hypothetical protein GCM10007380_15460 [Gottfriedia solisilvae]|uniref:Uncharacterized protein n=1 Tax=Gottfriedia solisilvae TaxID=1516104 RepID=A0A8J3AL68_9BACI|nr:hypothetical protein [Gottfriedia solisilvae]GGI12947.1 hypothetical protein GCM10007380_15460 [Gottfriedia solisilvae]
MTRKLKALQIVIKCSVFIIYSYLLWLIIYRSDGKKENFIIYVAIMAAVYIIYLVCNLAIKKGLKKR